MEFLTKNKRFSFLYDGKDIWETKYRAEVSVNGSSVTTVYDFENGLRITDTAKKYEEFGAYEWVNTIENTGENPSGLISELWDCDITLPMEHEDAPKFKAYAPDPKTATKLCVPNGSDCAAKEFYCDIDERRVDTRIHHLPVGKNAVCANVGGRSSDGTAPFFTISKNGCGYIAALGWSGQWKSEFSRETDCVRLRAKIEDTSFRVLPGEKFRTLSFVLLPFENGLTDAYNLWRKLVKEEFSPIGKENRPAYAPFSYPVWGGLRSETVKERVRFIEKQALPVEYIWMDAGWYGADTLPSKDEFEGDWSQHNGDWRVSPHIHPNGLRDVAEAVHAAGKKFILWFEPERVRREAPIVKEHPEYFLKAPDPNDPNLLLNLGDPKAFDYCYNTLSRFIEELHLDVLRIDFNFSPLSFWRNNDTDERRGMSEILYINGLYRLWDSLLSRFPSLLIDNCASGGRRIDAETLKRSVPLWRSDFQCSVNHGIEGTQNHGMTFPLYMPYSGTGAGRAYDEYRIRSAYSPALGLNHFYTETETDYDTPEHLAFLRKYGEEFLRVRPYLSEDFYPLTEVGTESDTWCARRYDRPSQKDGIVFVFRRENSPYETARFSLGEIKKDALYRFRDADGEEFSVDGKTLCESGLLLSIPEKRKAKIYFYEYETAK